MKWFLNPCRRHRESLCLLASGLLSEPERDRIDSHLATCADCRSYFNQIKAMTVPLTGWEKHFAHIETGPAVQARLVETIASVGRPESVRPFPPKKVLLECWQQLIWPSRHIWTGLATVWILLLVANLSMQDHSPTALAKASPAPEIIMTWRQQERLLTELIGPDETALEAGDTVLAATQQRTAGLEILMT